MPSGHLADLARARADLETALGMLMACERRPGGTPSESDLQYAIDAYRLASSAVDCLGRAATSMREQRDAARLKA